MARYATMAMDAGARIIGGCCGTTPQHVAVMRDAIDKHVPGTEPSLEQIESLLGTITSGAKAQMGGDLSIAGGAAGPGRKASGRSRRSAKKEQ